MTDIASLGFSAETSQLVKAEKDLDRVTLAAGRAGKASDQLGNEARKASTDVGAFGAATDKATTDVNEFAVATGRANGSIALTRRELRLSGQGLRIASQQLSQVGQQSLVTGNFVQALAIQLPDLGLAFGAVGAAAGLLAAIVLPTLVSMFTKSANEAKLLKSAVDALAQASENLANISDNYSGEGIQRLIDKYGELNQQVLTLIERQRQVAINEGVAKATAAIDALNNELSSYLKSDFRTIADELGVSMRVAQSGMEGLGQRFTQVNPQVIAFKKALDDAANAVGFEAQAAAVANLLTQMEGTKLETSALYGELVAANGILLELANNAPKTGWMAAALGEVTGLAATIWTAVDAALALKATGVGASTQSGLAGGRSGGMGGPALDPFGFRGQIATQNRPTASRGGSGGGASSAVLTDLQKIAAEFEKLSEPFNQAQTAFSAVETAMDAGIISNEQYVSSLDAIEAAFLRTGGTAQQWQAIVGGASDSIGKQLQDLAKGSVEQLGDAFADLLVDGSANFADLAKSIIKDLIKIAVQFYIIKPLLSALGLGTVTGNALGGAYDGAGAMPYAKGGTFTNSIVSQPTPFTFGRGGALGVMGEAGPEAIMPLSRGADGSLGVQMTNAAQAGSGGHLELIVRAEEGDMFVPRVEAISQDVSVSVTQASFQQYNAELPERVYQISNDPRGR